MLFPGRKFSGFEKCKAKKKKKKKKKKRKEKKKEKKVLSSFCNFSTFHFQFSTFPFTSFLLLFFSIFTPFLFFPCLFFPGRSAEISPAIPTCYATVSLVAACHSSSLFFSHFRSRVLFFLFFQFSFSSFSSHASSFRLFQFQLRDFPHLLLCLI